MSAVRASPLICWVSNESVVKHCNDAKLLENQPSFLETTFEKNPFTVGNAVTAGHSLKVPVSKPVLI